MRIGRAVQVMKGLSLRSEAPDERYHVAFLEGRRVSTANRLLELRKMTRNPRGDSRAFIRLWGQGDESGTIGE
jgi:hypothetical protein